MGLLKENSHYLNDESGGRTDQELATCNQHIQGHSEFLDPVISDLKKSKFRNNYRPFQCKICGKAFLTSRDMKTHMKMHSIPYKCHMCEESFADKDLLDDHIRKDQRKSEVGFNNGVGDVKYYDLKQKKTR